MTCFDVAILTDRRYERPEDPDWYARQVLLEDGLVADALERRGLRTTRVDWARGDFDWTGTRAALFRTTWDYFHRADEFRAWLDRVAVRTRLINDARLVRWNMSKRYLSDLADRGVAVVPCRFVDVGSGETLADLRRRTGWERAVLKPVVSGAARETYLVDDASAGGLEETFRRLVSVESVMLQPFQQSVTREGELSLMVVGGRFTHAVRKVARPGDFRVQDDHGGTVHDHEAGDEQIAFAEAVVTACTPRPVYARVDAVRDDDGRLALMELELIEPEMFFRRHPGAAETLADDVCAALSAAE